MSSTSEGTLQFDMYAYVIRYSSINGLNVVISIAKIYIVDVLLIYENRKNNF